MNYSKTKWDQCKVEFLMKKYNWNFKSNEEGVYSYSNTFINYDNNKKPMQLIIKNSVINISGKHGNCWSGIKSYKELEKALEYYKNQNID